MFLSLEAVDTSLKFRFKNKIEKSRKAFLFADEDEGPSLLFANGNNLIVTHLAKSAKVNVVLPECRRSLTLYGLNTPEGKRGLIILDVTYIFIF